MYVHKHSPFGVKILKIILFIDLFLRYNVENFPKII